MKKLLLYFLIFLLLLGTGSLAFGFWNGRELRKWATAAAETKSRHNISAKEKNLEERFGRSWNSANELKSQSESFVADLDKVAGEIEAASGEIKNLSGPRSVQTAKNDLENYHAQCAGQVRNLASVVTYMNQLFEVAIIFDRIEGDTTLEDIQSMIGEAKEKSTGISSDILPEELKEQGSGLRSATENFLNVMEQTASGKIESNEQLNASYADFSAMESEFFAEAKKYIDSFPNLEILEKKIDAELLALGKIKFSLQ